MWCLSWDCAVTRRGAGASTFASEAKSGRNRRQQAIVSSSASKSPPDHHPPSPGVVAYLEGKPVGWCAVGPKHAYPRLMASRMSSPATGFAEAADITGTWAVSCFVVRREQRRRGVSARLLRAAVEYAAANGARTVEGYPVDPRRRSPCPEPNCFTAPCQCSSRPGSPKSTGRPPRECWSASSSSSAREQVSDGGE
jgi:GNAT superfamily N-acetyltransferase